MADADQASSAGHRFVGTSVPRKENRRFLTGRGCYIDDVVVPGALHCAFVRSTVARGTITELDTTEALALPGVVAVFTGAQINAVIPHMPYIFGHPESLEAPTPPLADGVVRHVGDPVALVVAEDRYIAEDGAERVWVDYDFDEAVVDCTTAHEAAPVHPDLGTNVAWDMATPPDPELDRIFASAPHVVTGSIRTGRQCQSPMETRGLIASFTTPSELTLWMSQQPPHSARNHIAGMLGLAHHQVRIITGDVGGGFGQKYHQHRDELAVIAAARLMNQPLKWIEDRVENLTAGGQGRDDVLGFKAALDEDGQFLAAAFDYLVDLGAYPLLSPEVFIYIGFRVITGAYRIPKLALKARAVFTNTPGLVSYRGPWAFESLVREVMVETAARQIGMDPHELRRRNVIQRNELPYTNAMGTVYENVSPAETLEQAAERVDIAAFRAEQAAAREQGRYLGLGASLYLEPSAMNSSGGLGSETANVRIELSGTVAAVMSTASPGNSLETTMAQIIADELGVTPDDVRVYMGDTAQIGMGLGAGGSRQGVMAGGAAKQASTRLREKAVTVAAHLFQVPPDQVVLENGAARVTGNPDQSMTLAEIAEVAYLFSERLPVGMESGLEMLARYEAPPITHSNAAHMCVCEVDVNTGQVKILRWVISEDAGNLTNPAVVDGQVAGGATQGIAGALFEHMIYDTDGTPLTTTYKDYLVPLITDIPLMEFEHHGTPSQSTGGQKGVGEGGAIVAPAALVNAVADALTPFNVSCTHMPLSPERIVSMVSAAESSDPSA